MEIVVLIVRVIITTTMAIFGHPKFNVDTVNPRTPSLNKTGPGKHIEIFPLSTEKEHSNIFLTSTV